MTDGAQRPGSAVLSGAAQGSPLSPRTVFTGSPATSETDCDSQLQARGRIDGIRLPDGTLDPACHQHADDTSIHTGTVAAAAVALQEAVLHSAADEMTPTQCFAGLV